eukprot:UN04364
MWTKCIPEITILYIFLKFCQCILPSCPDRISFHKIWLFLFTFFKFHQKYGFLTFYFVYYHSFFELAFVFWASVFPLVN